MLGNLHVRFGVGARGQFPGLHHRTQPTSKTANVVAKRTEASSPKSRERWARESNRYSKHDWAVWTLQRAGGTDTLPEIALPLLPFIRQMCPCCIATRGLFFAADRGTMRPWSNDGMPFVSELFFSLPRRSLGMIVRRATPIHSSCNTQKSIHLVRRRKALSQTQDNRPTATLLDNALVRKLNGYLFSWRVRCVTLQ